MTRVPGSPRAHVLWALVAIGIGIAIERFTDRDVSWFGLAGVAAAIFIPDLVAWKLRRLELQFRSSNKGTANPDRDV